MSARNKLRKFKLDLKSWVARTGGAASLPSPNPAPSGTNSQNGITGAPPPASPTEQQVQPGGLTSSHVSGPSSGGDSNDWPYLHLLGKSLEQSARSFGPLQAAVAGLIECTKIFETTSNQRKEYDTLRDNLESLFKQLQDGCTQTMRPAVTVAIEALCRSIQDEVSYIQDKQERGRLRRHAEAGTDADEILGCYRRIQSQLQRVTLNIDLSLWQIVDEFAADSRLKHLSPSLSACYNSAKAVELKRGPCTEGTRVDLLGQIVGWVDNSNLGSIFWVSGMAGTGKTTIAYSLCLELDSTRRLAASFFCSRLLPECRDVNLIIPSIAYQLSRSSRPFRAVLLDALEKDPDVHTRLLDLQFDALIAQPLLEVKDTLPDNLVVVIDALDECESKESTSQMLDLLLTRSSDLPIKFVMSSRPEPEIRDEMMKQSDQTDSRVVLHELDHDAVQADIEKYLRTSLDQIQPTADQIATLVERAGILFIYAATVVRYIGYDRFRRNPRTRLAEILSASSPTHNNVTRKEYVEIDKLYTTILRAALDDPGLNEIDVADMRQVLHTVICAREPLTVTTLSKLLKLSDSERVHAALRPLWSVLHVSETSEFVNTLHASFSDYMLDPSRSIRYSCDSLIHNSTLTLRCFDCFRDMRPQFNVCGLESSFIPDNQVEGLDRRIQNAIPAELFYGARYWTSHLCSAKQAPDLIRQLEEFLSVRLLLWMEVMNLKGCNGDMPGMIQLLESWNKDWPAGLEELIHDAWRFTTTFASGTISKSTPHIYTSMLPFWPESSPISKLYARHAQGLIKAEGSAIAQQQCALLATWSPPFTLCYPTFSPDSTQVALGAEDGIQFLGASTSQTVLPPLQGHWIITSLQFSPDGARVVSGSAAGTICIWDVKSGEIVLGPIKAHTIYAFSVAFSPDGTRVVSKGLDAHIFVWDAWSGQRLLSLHGGPGESMDSVKYSPDGHFIVSCGGPRAQHIIIWDAHDGQVSKTLCHPNPRDSFFSTDISPDGTRIASGSAYDGIHIWNIESGKMVLGLTGTTSNSKHSINSVAFSPNGAYLASGSTDGTICIWDTQTGDLVLGPLEGQTKPISSVSFSPNGTYIVSMSHDKTIYLWDARSMQPALNRFPGHSESVTSVEFSPDGTRILSSARDWTLCVWDAESGDKILGPLDITHSSLAGFSPDGARILYLGRNGVVLVDAQTGDIVLGPLEYLQEIQTAEFSKDGTRIVCSLRENKIYVVAADTGQKLIDIHPPSMIPEEDMIKSAAFSPDGNCIALGSFRGILAIHNAHNGQMLLSRKAPGLYLNYGLVRFSSDGTRVVSEALSKIIVRDAQTGELAIPPLDVDSLLTSSEFSPDGTQIVSSGDDKVSIWDSQTGRPTLGPVKWHTGNVECVRFSPDGTRIVSSSKDKSIRVTDVQLQPKLFSDSLLPTGREWELNTDGWVVDDQGSLIVWVPAELRTALMWPRTKLLISKKGWLRLNFSDARLGNSWAKCYQLDSRQVTSLSV